MIVKIIEDFTIELFLWSASNTAFLSNWIDIPAVSGVIFPLKHTMIANEP